MNAHLFRYWYQSQKQQSTIKMPEVALFLLLDFIKTRCLHSFAAEGRQAAEGFDYCLLSLKFCVDPLNDTNSRNVRVQKMKKRLMRC